ncbi:MAG: hypothetical protein RSA91_00380 [Bacilli bacterium]
MKNFKKAKVLITITMLVLFMFVSNVSVNANTYNDLEVKNENSILKYKIDDIKVEKGILEFTFKINDKDSKNIFSTKVEVKDEDGNILIDTPEDAEGDYTEKVVYKADVSDGDINKVKIFVYVFDEKFEFIDEVDMSKIPYNSTVVDIKALKKSDIKANGGESNDSFIKSFFKSNGFTLILSVILFVAYLIYKNKANERKQVNDRKQK